MPFITLPPLRSCCDLDPAAATAHPGLASPPDPGCAILSELGALRAAQATLHGHTAQADDEQDLYQFARGAARIMAAMKERASLHQLDGTRIYALKAAAFCLALAESCDRRLAAIEDTGL